MESEIFSPPGDFVKCCDCACATCSLVSDPSTSWLRSVKRKYDEFESEHGFHGLGMDLFSNAKVQIENECDALRETVSSQQAAIDNLIAELEEERYASSSAATEAMSMILRLQREKAEIEMEARQFKRLSEEKMAHDQQEVMALEDMLYKKEQVIQALTCEVQAYKHRMMSFGLTEEEAEGEKDGLFSNLSVAENPGTQFDLPAYDYPPLKCIMNENPGDDVEDVEKYAFGETPRDQLRNLEERICRMERNPSSSPFSQVDGDLPKTKNVSEKVIVGHSPGRPRQLRRISTESSNSFLVPGDSPIFNFGSPMFNTSSPTSTTNFKKMEFVPETEGIFISRNNASAGKDDMIDRVYTIDSVHNGVPYDETVELKLGMGVFDDYASTPREKLNLPDVSDPDIKKLYMRLQALEADRESMRQALISMRTDKAQLVLLKEIAQHLCKEMSPKKQVIPRKPSILGSLSFMSVFKWIFSFIFWRRKARRNNKTWVRMSIYSLMQFVGFEPEIFDKFKQWLVPTGYSILLVLALSFSPLAIQSILQKYVYSPIRKYLKEPLDLDTLTDSLFVNAGYMVLVIAIPLKIFMKLQFSIIQVTIPSMASVFDEYALKSQFETSIYHQNLFLYGYGALFNFLAILGTAIFKGANSWSIHSSR